MGDSELENKHKKKEVMKFIGSKQIGKECFIAAISILVTVIEISITYIIKDTMDIKGEKVIYRFLDFIPLLVLLNILYGIGKFAVTKAGIGVAVNFVEHEKIQLTEHIEKMPLQFLKKYESGELYTVIHENMSLVEMFLQMFPTALAAPFIITMTLGAMFLYSWKLSLVCIILIPVPTFLFGIINKPIEKKSEENLDNIARVNQLFKSSIEGIDIIKTYNLFPVFSDKFHKQLDKVKDKSLEIEKTRRNTSPLSFFLRIFPQCIIPLYGGYLAINGEITIGLLPAFSILIGNIFVPIETLLQFLTRYRETISAIDRIEKLKAIGEEREDGEQPILDSPSYIQFRSVDFAYSDKKVLNKVSLEIHKNEFVAVVGESGSGKSTLIKLIEGLYEQYTGSVKVFQQELRKVDLKELRRQIAVMSQEAFLLPGTIIENLLYGVEDYTKDEIIKAMEMTNLIEVINKLPDGMDTVLTANGMNLSKGQRQRIALTRVILKKAPVIILDEATAGLDPKSVEIIQENLKLLRQNHTIIMVTHDIQLASIADKIILIHNHQIKAAGTHKNLMDDARYRHMYLAQNS